MCKRCFLQLSVLLVTLHQSLMAKQGRDNIESSSLISVKLSSHKVQYLTKCRICFSVLYCWRLYLAYICPYAQRVWITRNCKVISCFFFQTFHDLVFACFGVSLLYWLLFQWLVRKQQDLFFFFFFGWAGGATFLITL